MPAYKDEKRGTWYVKFKSVDWMGNNKQILKRGFKREKDAKAYEREFLAKANADCNMTFGTLIELYMEDCKSRLKPTTYLTKEYMINMKVLPFFKDIPINKIEPATVRKWQNSLLDHENNYSQTYLKVINNQLSAVFNFAMKYYKLQSNPARVTGSMGKKNADAMLFWTTEEFEKFIDVCDNFMYSTIYQVLFWTGMRSGEMLALSLNDFDFENKTVSINKNYARHEGEDLIMDPKTPKSKRIITIPNFICNMIQEYVSKLYDYKPNERIFQIYRSKLNRHLDRMCKISGVKKIRIHDLRHSHASLLIEMNFSPLLISERLGHENVETTLQTYSHLYPNKHSEVSEKLQMMHDMKREAIIETCEK